MFFCVPYLLLLHTHIEGKRVKCEERESEEKREKGDWTGEKGERKEI